MKKNKLICLILIFSLFMGVFSGCKKKTKYSATFLDTFDTYVTLYAYCDNATDFNTYASYCHELFIKYNKLFDIYNNYEGINNIKTINDNSGNNPVKVDGEILYLIEKCIEYYNSTNGKTNVAMGKLTSLWKKYRDMGNENPENAQLPPKDEIQKAMLISDITDVIIKKEESTVFLKTKGMSLDVGAVAKGYACDLVSKALKEKGLASFVISAGGNVITCGMQLEEADGKWRIGVENPDKSGIAGNIDTLGLNDVSAVTAGGYQRYYTVKGTDYCHIIDPKTGLPGNNFKSVTVISKNSLLADFLATTLYLTDYETGKSICKQMEVEAMWVTSQNQQLYTEGYSNYSLIS